MLRTKMHLLSEQVENKMSSDYSAIRRRLFGRSISRNLLENSKTYSEHMKELKNIFSNENIIGFTSMLYELNGSKILEDALNLDVHTTAFIESKDFMTFKISDYMEISIWVSDRIDDKNAYDDGITISVKHFEDEEREYSFEYSFSENVYSNNRITKYENSILFVISGYLCNLYNTLLIFKYFYRVLTPLYGEDKAYKIASEEALRHYWDL